MKKKNVLEREILIDRPSSDDLFQGKSHERTANALADTIRKFANKDRAIGIDGQWGSGKSSIVEMAERLLKPKNKKKDIEFHFFTFDIWKSQGKAFRRSFLEQLLHWSKNQFSGSIPTLEKIEREVRGKTRRINTDNQSLLDWYGVAVLLFLPFLPIFYFWAKYVFDYYKGTNNIIGFLSSLPFWVLISFLAISVIWAKCKQTKFNRGVLSDDEKLSYRQALSRTILINSKQFENQTVTQHIREIDPNDFEFQSTLRNILSVVQGPRSRVVVVLDNIDRLPKDEVEDTWAQVRSVFSGPENNQSENEASVVTAIIPYARSLVGGEQENDKFSSLKRKERFSKIFNEILTVAPPVMSNTREFFELNLAKALPNFEGENESFRVYLIFQKMQQFEGGHATPRQTIAFINELTGLFVMHEAKFSLATIAVYIVHRDRIESKPNELVNGSIVDQQVRDLSRNVVLDKHLAAIAYNVDEELAFQVLLDPQIADAAIKNSPDALIGISETSGFDIRVNEVVQQKVGEWIESGDFGKVLSNFSILATEYVGQAKGQFSSSLVSAFQKQESFTFYEGDYEPYLSVFDICGDNQMENLCRSFLKHGRAHLESFEDEELSLDDGKSWMIFVCDLYKKLSEHGHKNVVEQVLSTTKLPTNSNFILGAAVSANLKEDIKLHWHQSVKLQLDDQNEPLKQFAIENPIDAESAFIEFDQMNAVTDTAKIDIANSLVALIISDSGEEFDSEKYSGTISLLARLWTQVDSSKRSEINVRSIFVDGQFYENLHRAEHEGVERKGLASALLLAIHTLEDGVLPNPTKVQPNGSSATFNGDEFNWYKEIFEGTSSLEEFELGIISDRTKEALRATSLIKAGNQGTLPLVDAVITKLFTTDPLPRITLQTLLDNFSYLKEILGNQMPTMLSHFASRIEKGEVSKIEITNCPIGVLSGTFKIEEAGWSIFHKGINEILQTEPVENWRQYLGEGTPHLRVLIEMITSSGIEFPQPEFREIYGSLISSVLSGEISELTPDINYNTLVNCIADEFHADIYRVVRESAAGVNHISLSLLNSHFPNSISHILDLPSVLSKEQKDNLIRHFLCPALEGEIESVLEKFQEFGTQKVKNFIKASGEATQRKLSGCLEAYSKKVGYTGSRSMVELIEGKRKAKSWMEMVFGTGPDEGDEAEAEDSSDGYSNDEPNTEK